MMTITKLKKIQRQLCLNNRELGEALGVDRNTVTRWRMGLHPISTRTQKVLQLLLHIDHMKTLAIKKELARETHDKKPPRRRR